MNISFIGYGNMAKAIARALKQQGSYTISAASPSLTPGINQDKIHTHYDNKIIAQNAEIIILAVKPSHMRSILQEITPVLLPQSLLISVASGLNLSWFSAQCRSGQAVVRTMPNTPASVNLAATAMIANQSTNLKQKQQAELIFSQIGLTTWIDNEEDMDTFTALSGSGPAYVFLFIEEMINAAVQLGLDPSTAKQFTLQTFQGALKLAQNNNLSLAELRAQVTSPGGTTAAALAVLQQQLPDLIFNALNAAKLRAEELAAS